MHQSWVAQANARALAAWQASSLRRLHERSPGLALLLVALVAAAFSASWLILQSPNFFSGYDFLRMHLFYKAYFREALLSGRLPLWNPHVGLGRPFLADIETATLYPPNLLVLPLGVAGGVAASLVLHQALAIYGGIRLGRTLGAGAAASLLLGGGIALASPFTARLASGAVQVYFTLCWWPILLWLAARLQDGWDRRLAAGFAGSCALAILAGNPPILYVEALGVAVFLAFRLEWPGSPAAWRARIRNDVGLLVAACLGLGLAAAQLLPFADLVGQGNRPLHSPAFAVANGLPPASWLSLIYPASAAFSPNWEYDLYCGLVPLFAAAGGLLLWRDRNVRALIGLGVVGALLAAGDRTPLLGWAARVIPGISALRLPPRYGIWVATSLLGIASIGISRRPPRSFFPLAVALGLAVMLIAWLRPHVVADPAGMAPYYAVHLGSLGAAAFLVGLWQARTRIPAYAGAVGAALALFCACDWLLAIRLEAPVYSQYGFRTDEKAVADALRAHGLLAPGAAPPRITFDPADLRENAGMTHGFSTYNSYANPALARVWGYLHAAAGVPESGSDFIRLPHAIFDVPERLDALSLVAQLDHRDRSVGLRPDPDPRAYLAFDAEVLPGWRQAEAAMSDGRDFHARVLLEHGTEPDLPKGPAPAGSSAAIASFGPEKIVVHTSSAAAGILVLGEAWYPGWSASVGAGPPQGVFPVNGWMRGASVPAGEHDVVFTYRERRLGPGLAISALSAVLLLGLLVRRQTDSSIL